MFHKIKKKIQSNISPGIKDVLKNFSYDNPDRVKSLKEYQLKYKFSILPLSYFEPVPDLREIDLNNLNDTAVPEKMTDIEIKHDFSFIEKNLELILNEGNFPEWLTANPMFPPLDLAAYASVIEKYKPSRITEIGAGYTTCFVSSFVELLNSDISLTAIEPFPNNYLKDLSKNGKVKLIEKKIQKINDEDMENIKGLGKNDILFIDTSHITTRDSDTNFIFIKLLPMLKEGVIVHVHDIYLPYDYSRAVYYGRGTFYNEQYLLAAIIANSDRFECLYSSYDVFLKNFSHIKPKPDNWKNPDKMRAGSSFWMRKK